MIAEPSLHLLLHRLSDDDELTDSEFAWLADRLEADADARAEYIRWRDQEANLYWDYSGTRAQATLVPIAATGSRNTALPSLLDQASRRPIPPSVMVALFTIAAVLIGLAMWPVSRFLMEGDATVPPVAEQEPIAKEYVARVVRSLDAHWVSRGDFVANYEAGERVVVANDDDATPKLGARLYRGQWLFLSAGIAEIYFDNGAEVILTGPAVFAVQGRGASRLEFGKLVGHCSVESARGFAVETPPGRVVDLGTEFGIEVGLQGDTNIDVLEGDVAFHPRGKFDSGDGELLTAGESLRISADGSASRGSAVDKQRYVRRENGRWVGLPNVVAGFRRDFLPGVVGQPTSARRWRYFWNEGGPIGNPANYVPLVWNAKGGYSPSAEEYPVPPPASFARITKNGGHPGIGSQQPGGDGIDRYVIAAYVVERPGRFELVNARAELAAIKTEYKQSLGVVVHIDGKPAVVDARVVEGVPSAFDAPLGELKAGQVIYVAIGPDGFAGNDQFVLDFEIACTERN